MTSTPATQGPRRPELQVDWTRCDGHGLCATLFPERIQLDEWGFPLLRSGALTGEDLGHARRAALACPALALRVSTS